MGDLLKADADALRTLAGTLSGVSDTIEGIAVTATVTMPGSPIAPATEQSTTAVLDAYRHIGASIRQMSTACDATASSYESVDSAFAGQLHSYESGL
ncbi:hypothetical protein [Rhodococcus sp. HNM0569]|uniref:hypothetical protein n=1 Tax=Rhodococcus sp. HNM0569 TaxID=2716340 RepID=UPI00146DE7C2|nr:hypothetical protein [Rhodococcus sp. HNM0569]NLU83031.1 hypothetical protein [Rhodococcus sp. HNM0569]